MGYNLFNNRNYNSFLLIEFIKFPIIYDTEFAIVLGTIKSCEKIFV